MYSSLRQRVHLIFIIIISSAVKALSPLYEFQITILFVIYIYIEREREYKH